jgi:hypothetical protein
MGGRKQQDTFRQSDALPAQFSSLDPILHCQDIRIIEHLNGLFETHAVLPEIRRRLGRVPGVETHVTPRL